MTSTEHLINAIISSKLDCSEHTPRNHVRSISPYCRGTPSPLSPDWNPPVETAFVLIPRSARLPGPSPARFPPPSRREVSSAHASRHLPNSTHISILILKSGPRPRNLPPGAQGLQAAHSHCCRRRGPGQEMDSTRCRTGSGGLHRADERP